MRTGVKLIGIHERGEINRKVELSGNGFATGMRGNELRAFAGFQDDCP
jgi:hypothetical protein